MARGTEAKPTLEALRLATIEAAKRYLEKSKHQENIKKFINNRTVATELESEAEQATHVSELISSIDKAFKNLTKPDGGFFRNGRLFDELENLLLNEFKVNPAVGGYTPSLYLTGHTRQLRLSLIKAAKNMYPDSDSSQDSAFSMDSL